MERTSWCQVRRAVQPRHILAIGNGMELPETIAGLDHRDVREMFRTLIATESKCKWKDGVPSIDVRRVLIAPYDGAASACGVVRIKCALSRHSVDTVGADQNTSSSRPRPILKTSLQLRSRPPQSAENHGVQARRSTTSASEASAPRSSQRRQSIRRCRCQRLAGHHSSPGVRRPV